MGLIFKQEATVGTTTPTTAVATYPGNCIIGSYLIAFVFWTTVSGSATVSDPTNGAWTSISGPTVSVDSIQFFHVPSNTGSTPLVVTATVPSSGANGIIILEYTGQAVTPFDAIATFANGSSTTATSNPVTTNFTNETLICFGLSGNATGFTPGSGWTTRQTLAGTFMCAEDQNQSAIGSYAGIWTQTPSATWVTTVLGFKSTTSVGPTPPSSVYSVPDCRVAPAGPNASRTVQATKIFDVQTSSNHIIPPTDSRAAGQAPVDSRVAANIPQNSRTPGTFGPGVN